MITQGMIKTTKDAEEKTSHSVTGSVDVESFIWLNFWPDLEIHCITLQPRMCPRQKKSNVQKYHNAWSPVSIVFVF